MRVILTGPSGDRYQLDTPDPALVGMWLKAIFDSFQGPRPPGPPVQFRLDIS